jgi:hypothetical protein
MFRPSGSSQKEFDKYVHSAKESTTSEFKKKYQYCMGSMQVIAYCAKVYALKNWKKVKDWSDIDIVVYDNKGKENAVHYYKYIERKPLIQIKGQARKVRRPFSERLEKEWKKNQKPVKKVTEVVLDIMDGDFSVKINGKWHGWLYDESVIIFADYIESQINKKHGKNTQNLESKSKKGV